MGKYFPKLSQTHVFIQTDENGGGFLCPMLPVSALREMENISNELSKVDSTAAMEQARKRMIDLVSTVMPAVYAEGLVRMDIPQLTELIAYLMYGDPNNDDRRPPAKKN